MLGLTCLLSATGAYVGVLMMLHAPALAHTPTWAPAHASKQQVPP